MVEFTATFSKYFLKPVLYIIIMIYGIVIAKYSWSSLSWTQLTWFHITFGSKYFFTHLHSPLRYLNRTLCYLELLFAFLECKVMHCSPVSQDHTGFLLYYSVTQGLKKVPSSQPGQVDFSTGQVTFHFTCPMGKGPRQVICQQDKKQSDLHMRLAQGKQNLWAVCPITI